LTNSTRVVSFEIETQNETRHSVCLICTFNNNHRHKLIIAVKINNIFATITKSD